MSALEGGRRGEHGERASSRKGERRPECRLRERGGCGSKEPVLGRRANVHLCTPSAVNNVMGVHPQQQQQQQQPPSEEGSNRTPPAGAAATAAAERGGWQQNTPKQNKLRKLLLEGGVV